MRRQSEAATALWIERIKSGVALRLPPHSKKARLLNMATEQTALGSNDLSHAYFARASRVSPGGVQSPVRAFKGVGGTPIFFRSAQGATMTSVDGREYIDFCQSFGPLMLGHRDPDVMAALEEMISTRPPGALAPASPIRSSWQNGSLRGFPGLRCFGLSLPEPKR